MPKKKNHHYIPRFYLKKFSIREEDKLIGLYNLENKRFIAKAPLRHQAYEKFLYGENDDIENALAEMEGTISQFFYHWTEKKQLYPPPLGSESFKLLKQFILYQAFRIPKAGDDMMESLNKGMKVLINELEPQMADKMGGSQLEHENPVLMTLLNSLKYEHLLDFLDFKFLVNLSPLSFITSDAPIVFYNQLMEKAGEYMGATGLVAKGLQIFYPIHPRLMICFYDPKIYDFGDGCENCIGTESIEEVHQLNGLQLINSNSQIFFDESISREYISDLSSHFSEFRQTKRDISKIIKQGHRKFFFKSSEDAHIDLTLDFYSLKVNPEVFKGQLAPLRHPSLGSNT